MTDGTVAERIAVETARDIISPPISPLPRELSLGSAGAYNHITHTGMSVEGDVLWTCGRQSRLAFVLPPIDHGAIAITFETVAFVWPSVHPAQNVKVYLGDRLIAEWSFSNRNPGQRVVFIARAQLPPTREVQLSFIVPTAAAPAAYSINHDTRELGIAFTRIRWEMVANRSEFEPRTLGSDRNVGGEARKSYRSKFDSGFWDRYLNGSSILDVGFRGYQEGVLPIWEGAIGVDTDYPGYDGRTLPFPTESQDAVYSSHCLEHIPHHIVAIQEWYRVTKFGGHIITVVPNAFLYERRWRPPSRWNGDHQRFYTPQSLLAEFEQALVPNSYRVRHLAENDAGYDYQIPPDQHGVGCYEIELVIQKIRPPAWTMAD